MKQRCVGAAIPVSAEYRGRVLEMVVHWCFPLDAVGQGMPVLNFVRYARRRDSNQPWMRVGYPSGFDEIIQPTMQRALEAAIASRERRVVVLTEEQLALLQMPTDQERPQ